MFSREHPAGNWLYPLISAVAVCIIAAAAAWILSSRWREHAAAVAAPEPAPGAPPSLSAPEILDRRLAAGEITVEEYEHLLEVIGRRQAGAAAAAAGEHAAASNGKNGKAAVH
jgi:hypothetical protein